MKNPIVSVKTKDNLDLYGILLEAPKKDAIIINIHGTADNFYDNDFIWQIAESVRKLNISMLSVNNRGAYTLELYSYPDSACRNSGAATEIFEKCVLDIDAWIKKALSLGYKKIILQGHSLGTEKIVYYMSKGKYVGKIKEIILLGFADSFGTNEEYLKKTKAEVMKEAKALLKNGKRDYLLSKHRFPHAGILPQTAGSYLNFFKKDSELSKTLPLRNGKDLKMYKNIKIPILGIIGDKEEFTVIPVKKAIDLLRRENKMTKTYQLKNCDHNFTGKEKELARVIFNFLRKNV